MRFFVHSCPRHSEVMLQRLWKTGRTYGAFIAYLIFSINSGPVGGAVLYGVATDFLFKCLQQFDVAIDCSRYYIEEDCLKAKIQAVRDGRIKLIVDPNLVLTLY